MPPIYVPIPNTTILSIIVDAPAVDAPAVGSVIVDAPVAVRASVIVDAPVVVRASDVVGAPVVVSSLVVEVVPVGRIVDAGNNSHSSSILAAPEVTDLKQYSTPGMSSLQCH